LIHIAGNYYDHVVGVTTIDAQNSALEKLTAIVFDLGGRSTRELILPYDKLNKSLSNRNQYFRYLRILVCGDNVVLEHNTYSTQSVYGAFKNARKAVSGYSWYRIKSTLFALQLEYIRTLTFLNGVVYKHGREEIQIPVALTNFQCGKGKSVYEFKSYSPLVIRIRRESHMYNITLVLRFTVPRHARNGIRYALVLGNSNIAFLGKRGRVYQVFVTDGLCGVIPLDGQQNFGPRISYQGKLKHLFRSDGLAHRLVVDSDERLILWPRWKHASNMLKAKVFQSG
jgi:hypothetical protein